MVFVVESSPIEVPRIHPYSSSSNPIQLRGFPTFYSSDGRYLMPVNLWMNYLVNGRKSKDLNSTVRALKRYWAFLENNELDWDVFPKTKFLRPTYRFRNDDLLTNARAGNIQFSTASLYMLHVIKFYEWWIDVNGQIPTIHADATLPFLITLKNRKIKKTRYSKIV